METIITRVYSWRIYFNQRSTECYWIWNHGTIREWEDQCSTAEGIEWKQRTIYFRPVTNPSSRLLHTAKQMWKSMIVKYQGSARVRRAQQRLRRVWNLRDDVRWISRWLFWKSDGNNKWHEELWGDMNDVKIIEKIIRSPRDNFNFVVYSIEESKDIDRLTVGVAKFTFMNRK